MLGYRPLEDKKTPTILTTRNAEPEANAVDWRESGCVVDVKDQGACGSCYSFSATAAIETEHCIKTGEKVSFAEKDCLDCSFR